jgi:hypothetical protein
VTTQGGSHWPAVGSDGTFCARDHTVTELHSHGVDPCSFFNSFLLRSFLLGIKFTHWITYTLEPTLLHEWYRILTTNRTIVKCALKAMKENNSVTSTLFDWCRFHEEIVFSKTVSCSNTHKIWGFHGSDYEEFRLLRCAPCRYFVNWSSGAATCSSWFLARGFSYPEDGGNTFLRNVGSEDLRGATSQKTAFFCSNKMCLQFLVSGFSKTDVRVRAVLIECVFCFCILITSIFRYWWEIQKERDHWEDQDVGGWTILKWILER